MKFVNNITFDVVFGSEKKSAELRSVFHNIFENYYKVCASSIQIDNGKIILNLTYTVPKSNMIELDENVVVGVDLGIAVPAVCALNNNNKIREFIGSANDFIKVRTKIEAQRRRLSKSLALTTNGGHGRVKKMKPMEIFTKYEKNFAKTYNHNVSRKVVDFALKNKAKYINIEDLSGYNSSNYLLGKWSYFQLQQDIIYKAERLGIVVRKVKAAYTSQKCSCCGNIDSANRPKGDKGQAYFKCTECGVEMNADFNAARNISMSTEFVD